MAMVAPLLFFLLLGTISAYGKLPNYLPTDD